MSDVQDTDAGQAPASDEFDSTYDEILRQRMAPKPDAPEDDAPAPSGEEAAEVNDEGEEDNDAGGDGAGDEGQGGAATPDPKPAEEAPDPWATAPEELKTQHQSLRKEFDDLKHRVSSDEGRVRSYQQQAAAEKKRVQELEAKLAAREAAKKPSVDDAIATISEALADEDGKLSGPLKEVLTDISTRLSALDEQAAQRAAEDAETQRVEKEAAVIYERHPDADQIKLDPNFHTFVNAPTTPEFVRRMYANNIEGLKDGAEVADLFDLYKQHVAAKQPPAPEPEKPNPEDKKRALQKEGAKAPASGGGGSRPTGAPDDYDGAFDHFASKR